MSSKSLRTLADDQEEKREGSSKVFSLGLSPSGPWAGKFGKAVIRLLRLNVVLPVLTLGNNSDLPAETKTFDEAFQR